MRDVVEFTRNYSRTSIEQCSPSERDDLVRTLEADCTAALTKFLCGDFSEDSFHAANARILKALRKIGHPLKNNHMYDDDLEVWDDGFIDGPSLSVHFRLPAEVDVGWGPVER